MCFCNQIYISFKLQWYWKCLTVYVRMVINYSVCLPVHPPIHPPIRPSIRLPTYLPTYLSIYLPTRLPTNLPNRLLTHLTTHPPAHVFTYLSIHPSIYCLTLLPNSVPMLHSRIRRKGSSHSFNEHRAGWNYYRPPGILPTYQLASHITYPRLCLSDA